MAKQSDHKKNMNEKQEIPEVSLNATSMKPTSSPKTRRGKGDRTSAADESEALRSNCAQLAN